MGEPGTPIPLYTSSGRLGGFLVYPYIFNPGGEWIGFVTPTRQVYSIPGRLVGWLSKDLRILGKRNRESGGPKQKAPAPPGRFIPPAIVPLAPLMAELTYDVMDVLEEDPDLLPTQDAFAYEDDLG